MGLTKKSTGTKILYHDLDALKGVSTDSCIVALAGNPNVGKSSIFNILTGLNQHTGNWPGKTVTTAYGHYKYKGKDFIVVDLPGTYSLLSNSPDEEIARNFICFSPSHLTAIIVDATCVERNLNLVLQIIEMNPHVIVCVNLIDEAERKNINVNINRLSEKLGVPVIATSASKRTGFDLLKQEVLNFTTHAPIASPRPINYDASLEHALTLIYPRVSELIGKSLNCKWVSLKLLDYDESIIRSIEDHLDCNLSEDIELNTSLQVARDYLREQGVNQEYIKDIIASNIISISQSIAEEVVTYIDNSHRYLDSKIDSILTSKKYGIPIMILMLCLIFWITITGSNYPSTLLSSLFLKFESPLFSFLTLLSAPLWLQNALVLGIYKTLTWVISVMLPPMAIFFPLFTLLEDLGYLPRVAFNLDNYFKKACSHGKQSLTMCMGFGCNAAGIIGCRIIDSPREKLIAIITNNFVPCNGRFPTLIAIITMFFVGNSIGLFSSILSTTIMTSIIVFSIIMTLLLSKLLSKTILKGLPSSFLLELPPYRKPQLKQILIRSILDRTIFVLGRAIVVAAPAGLVIWVLANTHVDGSSLLSLCANFLNPFAHLFGLDGYILMAFILGFPANEIVFPIIIMSYLSTGMLMEFDSLFKLKDLLVLNGWTWLTALCTMLFCLMHFPCSTTCLTIRKETLSLKWTFLSFLIPTLTGLGICFVITTFARLLGLA